MTCRCLVVFGAVAAVVAVASVAMAGQAPRAAASPAATTKPSTPPRTAWGDPDLNGLWQGFAGVPLERPNKFAGREFLTDTEVAAMMKAREENNARKLAGNSYEFAFRAQANFNNIFAYSPNLGPISRRTAQIIDPPNGRLPPLTPEALKRWEAREAMSHGRGENDSYVDRTLGERCIEVLDLGRVGYWGLGDPAVDRPVKGVGGVDDANYQGAVSTVRTDTVGGGANAPADSEEGRPTRRIVQSPGFVAVFTGANGGGGGEAYRIIPLAGHPALGPTVRQFLGDARGHWDGNTLVVETTNLNYPDPMMNAHGYNIYPGTGETLRVIERYTRVDADHLEYRYTIDDPAIYTRPYTVLQEFTREDSFAMAPGLCHENNKDIGPMLGSGRADEAAALDIGAEYSAVRLQRLEEVKAEWTKSNKNR